MLADRLGFQYEASLRHHNVRGFQPFEDRVITVFRRPETHRAQRKTPFGALNGNENELPFPNRLHCGYRHNGARHPLRREFDIRVHFDPKDLARIRHFNARLCCARRRVYLRLDVGDAALPRTPRIRGCRYCRRRAYANRRKVFLVHTCHHPYLGEIGNGKEILSWCHNQTHVRVTHQHYAVDRRRNRQIRVYLFCLFQCSNLPIVCTKQLQFFLRGPHMRFVCGMARGHFLFLLLAGRTELDEVLRSFEPLVVRL